MATDSGPICETDNHQGHEGTRRKHRRDSFGGRRGEPRLYGSCVYDSHPFTNSTRLRRAIPDGPLAIHGLASSIQAVPAMSRWIQGVSSANSFRNMAAKMAPPQRLPALTMSAMFDLRVSLYSSSSGRRHIFSPACLLAFAKRSYIWSSLAKIPAFR